MDVFVRTAVDVGCMVDVFVGSGVKVIVGARLTEEIGGGGCVIVISDG